MTFRYGDPVVDPESIKAKQQKKEFLPVCLACGYDMRGNRSGTCPECGRVFVFGEWERAVREVQMMIADMEGGLVGARYAWVVAVVGVALRGLGILFLDGTCFGTTIRVLGFLMGIASIMLALNIFRAGKLPIWARPHLTVQPAYGSALVAIIGGATLITASIL